MVNEWILYTLCLNCCLILEIPTNWMSNQMFVHETIHYFLNLLNLTKQAIKPILHWISLANRLYSYIIDIEQFVWSSRTEGFNNNQRFRIQQHKIVFRFNIPWQTTLTAEVHNLVVWYGQFESVDSSEIKLSKQSYKHDALRRNGFKGGPRRSIRRLCPV